MIVVDANYFLRYLTKPPTALDARMAEDATRLFERVQVGSESVFVSDAVIAEVAFILTSKRHYGVSRNDAADALQPLLSLTRCTMSHKSVTLAALKRWSSNQLLDYVDALVIEYALNFSGEVATFDGDVLGVPGVVAWREST